MLAGLVSVLLLLVLCVTLPSRAARLLRLVERPLCRIGHRRGLAIGLSGVTAFAVSASISLLGQVPLPGVHDEFSYLLAADTFAHGRLTNPTHPHWIHFESMHIIHQPSYASKYPPAQGLILAAGQVATGQPIVGVWLSTALASAAVCWMLLAWLPPRWALLGGLLAALHPTMLIWGQSYWGGAVAVCGGALLVGGFRRIANQPRVGDSIWSALGIAILANSRPFEGLVLTLLSLTFFQAWIARPNRPTWAVMVGRIVLPMLLVLVPAGVAMGYYNWRVTGHPWRLPYVAYESAYGVARPFLWQAPRPEPSYRHKELRDMHAGWELTFQDQDQHTLKGFLAGSAAKIRLLFGSFFALLVLQTSLGAFPLLARDRSMRGPLLIAGLFTLALLSETWMHPHYAAPAAGLFLLLGVQALRYLRLWQWRGRPAGRILMRASLLVSLALSVGFWVQLSRATAEGWPVERARILKELTEQGGRHLVFVHYRPDHSPHAEWVYNAADIDSSPVVWAREMKPEQNRELTDYFQDRRSWLLDADAERPMLVPYTSNYSWVP
jgi:hypothetical protein